MKITRRFTTAGQDPFATVEYQKRTSRITNPDGSVVFEMNDAEIPKQWSQLATDIMVSKYFRKAGVPQDNSPSLEGGGQGVGEVFNDSRAVNHGDTRISTSHSALHAETRRRQSP
jgi:ribonucleoside-diphosphate reductase alpha chain